MKNILYIGNKLSHHGFTKGVIETLGPQLESEGFSVMFAGTMRNQALRLLEMLFSILVHSRKIDFVLIDTYSSTAFWYSWLSGLFCRLLKIKYIHILHGGSLPDRLQRSKWLCDNIFKYSYANVAVSGYLKDAFDKSGYKSVLIPNNIDINQYPFIRREKLKPRLLWVRSFHKIYNPNMAADVLVLLLKDFPDAELCMVGPDKDGSLEVFRSYCEKLGVAERVIITGLLPKPEWHKLSEEYDIFINTTNIDNTPVSVIESMALGLPVVSTNVGGIPFLLNNDIDAILVDKGDTNRMVDSIKILLRDNSFANSIIVNARTKAESFDWEQVKNKWIELLKDE
jgi:glycosyltransferase involved in cell wall biosynthesis